MVRFQHFHRRKGIGMSIPDDITFFSAVDRSKEPDFFKRFLDEGNKLPGIIARAYDKGRRADR